MITRDPIKAVPLWLAILVLVLVTAAVYWQVSGHEFLLYDDDKFLVDNTAIQQGLNSTSVIWAFTTNHASLWLPLTWVSHTVDFQLFGMDAGQHHLANLAWHLLASGLLLLLLARTTGRLWRSAVVAALFALHPLHVESVAWVTERKDTLSTVFLFLTLLAWHRHVARPSTGRYLVAFACAVAGLLTKPMLVTLPVLMVLVDLWPLGRRWSWRLVTEKIPFWLAAATVAAVTVIAGRSGGIIASFEALPLSDRLLNAVISLSVYLLKFIWPSGLHAQYPFDLPIAMWKVAASVATVAAVTWVSWRQRRDRPWLITGWLWYLVTLLPVLGILQQGSHAMADRYTYISLVGIFVMVVWTGADLAARLKIPVPVLGAGVGIWLALLSVATYRQAAVWRDTETLFAHAVSINDRNPLAWSGLGAGLAQKDRLTEATDAYRRALELNPFHYTAHSNLGQVLARRGMTPEAVFHLRKSLIGHPDNPRIHYHLAGQLRKAGQDSLAAVSYLETLRLAPMHAGARTNLGLTRLALGDYEGATELFLELLAMRPDDPLVSYNLACVHSVAGEVDLAARWLAKALEQGFADADLIARDPDLANLRQSTAFEAFRPGG